jgi:hypothetical protein
MTFGRRGGAALESLLAVDRTRNYRNIAIVVAIAAAVFFLPGGGRAAHGAQALLSAAFAAGFGYFGYRLYREHHVDIDGLGDRHRALLYGALAVGLVTIAAKARMWETGAGEFAWFVLIGLVAYGLIAVYRHWRTY